MTTDQTPPAAAPAPPAAAPPVDPRKALASAMVARSFRLQEVMSELRLSPEETTQLLLDPETQAHLDRLIGTGEYAGDVMGAREALEITTGIARMSVADFIAMVRSIPTNDLGSCSIGPQSIPAFLSARLRAIQTLAALKYGRPGSLKAALREATRKRKERGQAIDRTSVHRALQELFSPRGPAQ